MVLPSQSSHGASRALGRGWVAHRGRASLVRHTFDTEHTAYRIPCNTFACMNKADSDRVHQLCAQIAVEQDRKRFLELVTELNRILAANELTGLSPKDVEH